MASSDLLHLTICLVNEKVAKPVRRQCLTLSSEYIRGKLLNIKTANFIITKGIMQPNVISRACAASAAED
jgi:hypothetical protein